MSEQDSLSYVDVASIGDFDGEDSVEDIDIFWRTVFRGMARMSSWSTVIEEDCSQLFRSLRRMFRSLRRMCVPQTDVHVGQTDVPTESPEEISPEEFAALADVAGRRRTGTDDSYAFSPDGCYPR